MVKRRRQVRKRRLRRRTIPVHKHVRLLKSAHKHHTGALKWIWKEVKKLGAPLASSLEHKAIGVINTVSGIIDDL